MDNNITYQLQANFAQPFFEEQLIHQRLIERKNTVKFNRIHKGDIATFLNKFLSEFKDYDCYTHQDDFSEKMMVIVQSESIVSLYRSGFTNFGVTYEGDPDFGEKLLKFLDQNFDIRKIHMEWVYLGDNEEVLSTSLPLNLSNIPTDSVVYPWLNQPLEKYYQNYLDSESSVLVLIGPPGTGKTSFIKGLLTYSESNGFISYDERILSKDSFFLNFIQNESRFLILEDADNMLLDRKEGNSLMVKFLNISGGLIDNIRKKIILSTNLSNLNNVDPALIRPGRCYDVLKFRKLEGEEITKVQEYFHLPKQKFHGPISLAEILNQKLDAPARGNLRSFGFVDAQSRGSKNG